VAGGSQCSQMRMVLVLAGCWLVLGAATEKTSFSFYL
jgi:hypothetical protein